MRFCLSGSEAVHVALRLARATTGKQKFIRFEGHYHGWFDNVAFGIAGASLAQLGARDAPTPTTWSGGLPDRVLEEAIVLPWNDLDLSTKVVELRHTEMAAIITEPVMCNSGCIPPREGYLQG